MKLVILEANAEELRSNKRVMDGVVDSLVDVLDDIFRLNGSSLPKDEEENEESEEEEEDEQNS